jgi:uncharacterized phage protein gp47/JayE
MSFELTPSGLSTQTQEEVVEETGAKARSTFGNNTNTSTESLMGQLINIWSEFRARWQQTSLQVYRSFDPSAAQGVSLDQRAALTGSIRKGATNSTVDGVLTFSSAGTVSDGDQIQNDDNETTWGAINGPYVSAGPWPEDIPATFSAIDTGPLLANANTNWSLITAVPGLDTFTNPADDADLGRSNQEDPSFRVSRQIELYSQNIGGKLAIKGVVSKVNGVETVRVEHNPATQPVDVDGIPFKAFNVIVETAPSPPGAALQQAIGNAIFSAMGAGGEAFGTSYNTTVVDVEGNPQPNIRFDLVAEVDVFARITISTTDTEQPVSSNIATVIRDGVLLHAQENFADIRQNQIAFEYVGAVYELQNSGQISGLTSVSVELSRVALVGPYADPVEINVRERPSFESVNIQVVIIP